MRVRRDIDDLDNLFDRDEAVRLRQERADMVEAGKRRQVAIEAHEATVSRRVADETLKASDVAIIREYQNAGVDPLKTNDAGVPTCSLSLLFRLGWSIQDLGRGKELIEPAPQPKYVARGECS